METDTNNVAFISEKCSENQKLYIIYGVPLDSCDRKEFNLAVEKWM